MKILKHCILALFALIAFNTSAHDFRTANSDGVPIWYNITSETDLTVEVTFQGSSYNEYSNEYSGELNIPATVNYKGALYNVTSIDESAFRECSGLTSVTIPNSVTSIGRNAFYSCKGLTSVTIPNSVTSIGYHAFTVCSGLTGVYINDLTAWCNIEFGNDYANPLRYAHKLYLNNELVTDLEIPEGITAIKNYAFSDCSGLTSATIPNSVTSIEEWAFSNCSGLTSVTIPNSVTSIEEWAFSNCSGLTEITIPNSVTSIGYCAFSSCSGLTSVTIPNSVTSIGDYAFSSCRKLTSITIPNSVTSIGNNAFNRCYKLTSIAIPNSVTSIGDSTFIFCEGLTEITIPNSVTSIGDDAFYYCTGLTEITIPNSVTSIGNYTFKECKNLKKLIIEDGDKTLFLGYNYYDQLGGSGYGLFRDCPLETLYLGRNLNYDTSSGKGYSPFYNKTSLKSLTIGNSVTYIGGSTFSNCSGLTGVYITDLAAWCNIKFESSSSNPLYYAKKLYLNNELVTDLEIPEGITAIKNYAFSGCSGLTGVYITDLAAWCNIEFGNSYSNPLSYAKKLYLNNELVTDLEIPEGITAIKNYAFSGCSGLTSVTIPNSVTSIGDYAFSGCSGLTSVTIPNSVTSIGDYAFSECTGIKELIIEDGNETLSLGYNAYFSSSIGQGLFYDCPLETLYLGRNLSYDNSYSYGYSPFYNKTSLKSLTIGNSVTYIGGYAFYGCSKLTSITIPNSVTSIGGSAFSNCSGLTKITIPNSVTSIGDNAFAGCSGLTSITSLNENPPTLSNSTFTGVNKSILVYIPLGSYSKYSGSTWKYFNNFKECDYYTKIDGIEYILDENYNFCITNADKSIIDARIKDYIEYNGQLYPVTLIDENAFKNCNNMKAVTISENIDSIGNSAFANCSALEKIYSLNNVAPTCATDAFSGVNSSIPVHVPKGATNNYYWEEGWDYFYNFIESDFVGVEDEEISTSEIKVIAGSGININEYYGNIRIANLSGQIVKDLFVNGSAQICLPKGIYIVVTKNKSQKIVL